jgi:hypothetical protein
MNERSVLSVFPIQEPVCKREEGASYINVWCNHTTSLGQRTAPRDKEWGIMGNSQIEKKERVSVRCSDSMNRLYQVLRPNKWRVGEFSYDAVWHNALRCAEVWHSVNKQKKQEKMSYDVIRSSRQRFAKFKRITVLRSLKTTLVILFCYYKYALSTAVKETTIRSSWKNLSAYNPCII